MEGIELQEFVRCPACNTLVDTRAALCANCGYTVNKERAKELGLTPKVA
jgi:rRNA maturation endonuclease Nob1